jgi:MFS family permease
LGVDDVWISLAYSWSAILWVTTAPYWARKSDQRGRKTMMALGMIGFISSFALCGALLWLGLIGVLPAFITLILFAVARGLYGGFGSAAPPAVQAYIASRTARADRTKALSLIASSFGLGTVIGPALAPLLLIPGLGLVGPFVAFALFGLVTLIALRLRLPNDAPTYMARGRVIAAPFSANSNSSMDSNDEDADEAEDARTAAVAARPAIAKEDRDPPAEEADIPKLSWFDPRLRPWLLSGLIGGHAQAAVMGISGFLILDRLGLRATPDDGAGPIGLVLMAGAIATLLAQWGIIPLLKLGPRACTLWGMALATLGAAGLAFASELHPIALSFALASLGFGMYRPGFTAGSSLSVSRAEQGQVSGIVASLNGAAYVLAPALGVLIYNVDSHLAFGIIMALCIWVFVAGLRLKSDAELESAGAD